MKKANMTQDEIKRMRRSSYIKLVAMVGFVAAILAYGTISWFTQNKANNASSMGVKVETDVFTISPLSGNDATPGVFADKLLEAEELTGKSGAMTWTMTPDYHMINVQNANNAGGIDTSDLKELGLRPGAYGEIRFILTPSRPKVDAEFTFDLYAFVYQSESNNNETAAENTNENLVLLSNTNNSELLDLLNGHILLFGNRNGSPGTYQYSDFILSNDMSKRVKSAQYTGVETVSIFWVWPDTLAEIVMPTGSRHLNNKVNLCSDATTYAKVKAYFKAHPEYLFYDENNTNTYTDIKGSSDIAAYLADGYYDEYSSLYNNADQYIGTNVGYVMLYVNAEGTEHVD